MILAAAGPAAAAANSADGAAYLRDQAAAARAALDRRDRAAFEGAADRTLSLVASLPHPEAEPAAVAQALSEAIGGLTEAGEVERAWGLYKAGGKGIAAALPAATPPGALWRLREAELLQQVGDAAGALGAVDAARAGLEGADLARAMTLKAAMSVAVGDFAAARAALAAHPFAALHARPGRVPASEAEVRYLAVRALVGAFAQAPEPALGQALGAPPAFRMDPLTAARVAVYRTAGAALAAPPGPERQARLVELGDRIRGAAAADPAWRRPGVVEQLLIAVALTQAPGAAGARAEAAFTLVQLAGRTGPSFDADALAALSLARDDLQRRTIHQALRLRARRDRLERIQVRRVADSLAAPRPAPGLLAHDAETRLLIRDFDQRIVRARQTLDRDGVALDPPLASLARLRAALGPDEAALAVAQAAGAFAYVCVRREGLTASLAVVDPVKLKLDTRLLQQALTATYAPSEALDAQFPVEAATRLYDALVRPFETCLKPGDRIVWLSSVATAGVPLAALLRAAPPKRERGWDLAAADWLVRRHAVSYAGSAEAVLAARTGVRRAADLDFLGVGDPALSGRFSELAPLPETRDELVASARGFPRARLLLQAQATERAFRGEMVGAYRYLSFATHGLIRDDLQGLAEPALVLTPVAPADPLDDGLLTANEIADLDLHALFVALSACNTANFDQAVLAQELPALTSAFAVAGAPATLATLWPVNSETGKQVVSGVFERLRGQGVGPAEALAQAQRAFLAAPPGRAYLHPRFWAPFVVLGDGAANAAAPAARPALTAVETLTRTGGEVLALAPTAQGMAQRFVGDADAAGRRGGVLRLAQPGGEAWRHTDQTAAARFLAVLDGRVVTGGYMPGAAGRYAPTLTLHDPATGAVLAGWRGDGLAKVDAFLLAGLATGPTSALIAVGEINLRDPPQAGGGRVHVLKVDPALGVTPLFTAEAPPGTRITDATLALMGGRLLLTYSGEAANLPPAAPTTDDYDLPTCLPRRTAWLELRDLATGRRIAAEAQPDLGLVAAVGQGSSAVLGGARWPACGESQAVVLAVDASLKPRPLYADESLGASEVRALAALPGGRVLAAASKASVVDYEPPSPQAAARADPYAIKPFSPTFAALLATVGPKGATAPPKVLESGANIYATTLAATGDGEVLLGGALAGQAAIFHLTPAAQ